MDFRTPGQLINASLESKGWNQRTLAIVLGMDETAINRVLSDKRPVTAELAVILEEILGIPAEQLLDLQREYELNKARITVMPDKGRNTRAQLYGGLPVAEMIKRGWIQASNLRDVSSVENGLSKFFGVVSPDEIEILPHAAKKTIVSGEVTPTQLAWLYRVKQISKDMIIPRYSPISVRNALPKLSALLASPQEVRKVPRIIMESGVRFVIVESLPSANIDGVCLWLDDNSPVIGMSLRHDRIDNFWFVLRHELEHVIRLHGRSAIMLDIELEEKIVDKSIIVSQDENIANQAAAEFCVPQKSMDSFIARKSPLFTERDMLGFSRVLNIHPGLVVGQLQHRTGRYELFRKYLIKVKALVTPSAIVDGWGDIAPIGT